jgi:hypothetical protein
LLTNIPERDLKSLTGEFILSDINLAYEARAKYPWAAAIPKEIFFNEVLPYANLNEKRDDWRGDFMKRFGPVVADCKTAGEAAQLLNRKVFKELKVSYHATKRLKPDQSPSESMDIHFASCSGLSFILVDACRAVGIPARIAGTALWSDKSGNHTWVEVWDGQWRFIGAAEPGEFNKTWFAENAAKADDSAVEQRIHAVSFRHTDEPFLMVWDPTSKDYPAVDVTGFYAGRKIITVNVLDASGHPAGGTVQIRKGGELLAQKTGMTTSFELAAGMEYVICVESPDGRKAEKNLVLPKDADASVDLRIGSAGAQ